MNNLLEQWNEHVVKGNLLGRELEDIESFIDKTRDAEVCFTSGQNGTIRISILSPEKLQEIRESIIMESIRIRNSKETELKKHMNSWKPATVNPEFEEAVQEMVAETSRAKYYKVKKDVNPELEALEKEQETPVVKQEEQEPEDKSLDKYPATSRKVAALSEELLPDIRRMYVDENKSAKEIAEVYGVKHSDVSNFIYKHKLNRRNYDKDFTTAPPSKPAETECP